MEEMVQQGGNKPTYLRGPFRTSFGKNVAASAGFITATALIPSPIAPTLAMEYLNRCMAWNNHVSISFSKRAIPECDWLRQFSRSFLYLPNVICMHWWSRYSCPWHIYMYWWYWMVIDGMWKINTCEYFVPVMFSWWSVMAIGKSVYDNIPHQWI